MSKTPLKCNYCTGKVKSLTIKQMENIVRKEQPDATELHISFLIIPRFGGCGYKCLDCKKLLSTYKLFAYNFIRLENE